MSLAIWKKRLSVFAAGVLAAVSCIASDVTFDNDRLFDYFFYEAVEQGNRENYAEAFDLLLYCLEINPESAAVRYELATYYMALGDRSKPGELLREAVRLEPENYWYWQLLGTFYARQHQYADAVSIYEKMAGRFPSRSDILITLMTLYEDNGQYSNALEVLRRIELLEGESMQVTLQRFQLYLEKNDIDSAYVTMKSNVEWAIETMSEAVTSLNELNSVRQMCRLALADSPDNLTLHYWNAVSDYRAGEKEKALADIEAGVGRIAPGCDSVAAARLYTLKGDFCYNDGRKMEETFAAYARALELNPSDNMTANNYAYFLSLDRRELKKAESLSLRTIMEEPLNATYLDTYAWILFAQERYVEALEYIDRAVQCMDEPSADVMEHCGDIHYMNGDVEGAVHYWHEAVELHSESVTIEQKILQQKYVEEDKMVEDELVE